MKGANRPEVIIGLQGTQVPASAVGGIGRWADLYTLWLVKNHRALVAGVSIDADLPIPKVVSALPADLPVLVSEETPPRNGSGTVVFHPLAIFEDLDLARIWPQWARDPSVGLTVTVLGMIAALYRKAHFQGASRYVVDSRLQMVVHAGSVITNSAAAARDVTRRLAVKSGAAYVAPLLVGSRFAPYPWGRGAAHNLVSSAQRLEPDFILSNGDIDPLQNLVPLIRAYACLPPRLRARHQLLLTWSHARSEDLAGLLSEAENLGVADRVIMTPPVDDSSMALFYQSCQVTVLASEYEGVEISLAEAMQCGAATIVSDVAPMRELVPNREARFFPGDVPELSRVLGRVLDDPVFADVRRTEAVSDSIRLNRSRPSALVVDAYALAARRCP
jgi:glycosyltransferase involved in cell wall biosynthesis